MLHRKSLWSKSICCLCSSVLLSDLLKHSQHVYLFSCPLKRCNIPFWEMNLYCCASGNYHNSKWTCSVGLIPILIQCYARNDCMVFKPNILSIVLWHLGFMHLETAFWCQMHFWFSKQPISWRTSKRKLFWPFVWTHGNFSLAQMMRLSFCVKQVKAPFKMLLAIFLSLYNNRCSRASLSIMFSKIANYMAVCLFWQQKNFFLSGW